MISVENPSENEFAAEWEVNVTYKGEVGPAEFEMNDPRRGVRGW